ncbi:MAG: hypothetical protein ACR2OA_10430 [Rubripirellula sp.]
MATATKKLTLAMAFVAGSFQIAFAVDGKTPCTDIDEPQSSSFTITLSPTDQPGVMREDDDSWWWQPSNGEPPFRLPEPDREPEPEPEPEPSQDRVSGDNSLSLNLEIYFWLEILIKDGGLTFDEACDSVLTEIILPSEDDETELKRPTFGPHIITCDFFNSKPPDE